MDTDPPQAILDEAVEEARALWTSFDLPLMYLGVLVAVLCTLRLIQDLGDLPGVHILCLVLYNLSLLSNSFLNAENVVLSFLVSTLLIFSFKRSHKVSTLLLHLFLIRVLSTYTGPLISSTGNEMIGEMWFWRWIPSVLSVFMSVNSRNMGLVFSAMHWALQDDWVCAWICFGTSLGGLLVLPVYQAVLPGLGLVLGPASMFPLVLVSLYVHTSSLSLDPNVSFVFLFSMLLFFSFGHRCDFGVLHITAPYVGFDSFNYIRGVVMLSLDTFGHVLVGYGWNRNFVKRTHFVALLALRATVTTVFVLFQRRHLMVWAIFAPKLVFDLSSYTFGVVLLVLDMCVRWKTGEK